MCTCASSRAADIGERRSLRQSAVKGDGAACAAGGPSLIRCDRLTNARSGRASPAAGASCIQTARLRPTSPLCMSSASCRCAQADRVNTWCRRGVRRRLHPKRRHNVRTSERSCAARSIESTLRPLFFCPLPQRSAQLRSRHCAWVARDVSEHVTYPTCAGGGVLKVNRVATPRTCC